MPHATRGLTPAQQIRLASWLGDVEVLADLSWELSETTVLQVRARDEAFIVKAATGPGGLHHLRREIEGFAGWTDALAVAGGAARARHVDEEAGVIVLDRLPGVLVDGTPAAHDPTVHAQAGALLRVLHAQAGRTDGGAADRAVTAKTLWWLDQPHGMSAHAVATLRAYLTRAPQPPLPLVPTHGDYQPRNWLWDGTTVRVIDFGRFAFRPALTDFFRLSMQEWRAAPACEAAFVEAYGPDPRVASPDAWLLTRVRDAVSTAAWSRQVGDVAFEQHGLRLVTEVLAEL